MSSVHTTSFWRLHLLCLVIDALANNVFGYLFKIQFSPFSTIYKKATVLLLGLILFSPAPQITTKMLAAWSRLLGYYNPSVVQNFCKWKKYVFCSDCRLFPNLVHGASCLQWFEIDLVLEVSVCTADPECDSANFSRNSLSQIG